MKFSTILLILLFISTEVEAGTISGFVTDLSSGETLAAANVVLENTSLGTMCNVDGYYALIGVPAGTHILVVTYIGYESSRLPVSITSIENLRVDVGLKPAFLVGEEAVVEAERYGEERLAQPSFLSLRSATIKALPSIGEADLLRGLQLLPGVQAASDISSGLYVRGGGPDQTQILLDHIPLYNPSHAFGFFSVFNSDAIKDMSLYKSAYPANYGGSLGAVLDITNRDGNQHRFSSTGGISVLAARTTLEGPIRQGSYMVSGRRSYLEPVLAAIRSHEQDIPSYYFYDFNAKINQNISSSDKLVISGYFGRDNLDLKTKDENEFGIRWGNSAVTGKWTHLFAPAVFGSFLVSRSKYLSTLTAAFEGTEVLFQNSISDLSVKADLDYFLGNAHSVRMGFRGTKYDFGFREIFNQDKQLDLNLQPFLFSMYLQDEWDAFSNTSMRLGLRANYFSEHSGIDLEPRLSISHKLADKLRLKAGTGFYHQYLQLITTEGFSGGDFWVPLDGSVNPGQAWHYVLGAAWDPSSRYRFSLETYYHRLGNLVVVDNNRAADSGSSRSADVFINSGNGHTAGMELFIERLSGKFTGWIGYTLGWTRRRFRGLNQGQWFPPKYDRRHDIVVSASYKHRRWMFGANFVFGTGQAFTPASERYVFRESVRTGTRDHYFLPAGRNTARLLPYHRMDVSVKRTFRLLGIDWQGYLQVFNVYNRRNEWFVQYDTDINGVSTAEIVRMLPIVPTIGIDYAFK